MNELMGKIVLVDQVFERVCNRDSDYYEDRGWKVVDAAGRPGWVVGRRYLQKGTVTYDRDYGPTWKRISGHSTHALLVVYWPTMRPVRVPFDGYRLAPDTARPYCSASLWTLKYREYMRKETQDWPRDKQGRWMKK